MSFVSALLIGKKTAHRRRSISLRRGTGYALGLDVGMQGGRFMLEHSGEVSGFTAENIVFPEDSAAIVVLTNGPLGAATGFLQTRTALRGGMTYRSYRVTFPNRTIRVWTYETPDGKLEQYQVAPIS